jgi:RNA polymerase sigma factor for flagellar operon FliA
MFEASERERAIRGLLPLVRRIAKRIRRMVPSVDLDDLIGDGSIGLIRAVDSFDPSYGTTLEQYAGRIASGAMLNGIRRMDPVSERARRTVREGETERYAIAMVRGDVPGIEEMEQRRPGFTRATMQANHAQPLSLDAPLPDGERLSGDWSGDPALAVAARYESAILLTMMDRLSKRHRDLLVMHYFGERSLRDIGRGMSISPQRTSQLHLAALAKLRKIANAAPH